MAKGKKISNSLNQTTGENSINSLRLQLSSRNQAGVRVGCGEEGGAGKIRPPFPGLRLGQESRGRPAHRPLTQLGVESQGARN